MPRDHRNDLAVATNRDRLLAYRHAVAPLGVALTTDATLTPGAVKQRSLAVGQALADLVLDVGGLRGDRPNLRDSDEPGGLSREVRVGAYPQQQVGEREIGEQLPLADEKVQPVEVGVGQRRMPPDQADQIRDGGAAGRSAVDPSSCRIASSARSVGEP